MIITDIYEGLGNQLFQYAFARGLQERTNEELKLIYYSSVRTKGLRNYALNHFKLTDKVSCPGIAVQKWYDFYGKLKRRILCNNNPKILYGEQKLLEMIDRGMYISRDVYNYYDLPVSKKKNKYIIGFWQSPKYFAGIEDQIRDELQVVTPPSKENEAKLKEIRASNAVCVHIRLGDYLKYPKLNICTEKYYFEGMDYIAEHTENPKFYIFSYSHEDMEWIKNNYKFKYDVEYVDLSNPDYEELRLMYNCKHFVISNSTFSWWAQFLSGNNDKVVVAPAEWNRESHQNAKDIYMDNWHLINV